MLMVRTLVQEEYPPENLLFLDSAGIKFFQFPIPGNKEPFVVIPDASIIGALETILDKRNHPILVHCNAGKVHIPTTSPCISCPFLLLYVFFWVVSVLCSGWLIVASHGLFNGYFKKITRMGINSRSSRI